MTSVATTQGQSKQGKHDAMQERMQHPQEPHQPTPEQAGREPSGPRGDDPSTAGPGRTGVVSKTPENATGHINPSAPEDANITPGSLERK